MQVRRGRRRAFVLISTMFVILILGMLVRVALVTSPVMNRASGLTSAQERARRAAESGVEAAAWIMRDDFDWNGGLSKAGEQPIVREGWLKVKAQQGNVIGSITEADGSRSEFRIRFNYQDRDATYDVPDPEGVPEPYVLGDHATDPVEDYLFDFPGVSVNNLKGKLETYVPVGKGREGRVEPGTSRSRLIPPYSAYLVVEGRALNSSGKAEARQEIETLYQVIPKRAVTDAVMMAGGGVDANLAAGDGQLFLGGSYLNKTGNSSNIRMRSKKGISVTRSSSPGGPREPAPIEVQSGARGEFRRAEAYGGDSVIADPGPKPRYSVIDEDASEDFYSLPFERVVKASDDPDAKDTIQIKGGTYVYGQAEGDKNRLEMRYFDMSYKEYVDRASTGSGRPLEWTDGKLLSKHLEEVREPSNIANNNDKGISLVEGELAYSEPGVAEPIKARGMRLMVRDKDLRIMPSKKGTESFTLIPRAPAKFESSDRNTPAPSSLPQDPTSPDNMILLLNNSTLSAKNTLIIESGIKGAGGTLTSGSNVKIISGRTMKMAAAQTEVKEVMRGLKFGGDQTGISPENGKYAALQLNVYAKGDLFVSSYVGRLDKYRNLTFKGLLYSWGNVKMRAAKDGALDDGNIRISGALVAYGGNPSGGAPGWGKADRDEDPDALPEASENLRGTGYIQLNARNAQLAWDPTFLPSILQLQPENTSFYTLSRSSIHYLP